MFEKELGCNFAYPEFSSSVPLLPGLKMSYRPFLLNIYFGTVPKDIGAVISAIV